jgi:hypothetical protein
MTSSDRFRPDASKFRRELRPGTSVEDPDSGQWQVAPEPQAEPRAPATGKPGGVRSVVSIAVSLALIAGLYAYSEAQAERARAKEAEQAARAAARETDPAERQATRQVVDKVMSDLMGGAERQQRLAELKAMVESQAAQEAAGRAEGEDVLSTAESLVLEPLVRSADHCLSEALHLEVGELNGSVEIAFAFRQDGTLSRAWLARDTFGDAKAAECILGQARLARLPPRAREITVTFPRAYRVGPQYPTPKIR